MYFSNTLAAGLLLAAGASAQKNYLGFNSGSTKDDRSAKFKADFVKEFTTAKNLVGAPGDFSAVRLYTNIQAYSQTSEPIEAFEAAIETKTSILLGVWASGTDSIDGEIKALQNAIKKFGTKFTDLVIGISIGSEDLYRDSETGRINKSPVGASPDTIVKFIKTYRSAVAGTALANKPVGHVDTWDVWPNATNKVVMDAIDFIGVNEFPYYENGKGNNIKNAGVLFDRAYNTVLSVAGSKPVWVTETGWPFSGEDWDEAKPSVENAKFYWNEVGCRKLFGKTTAFWYALGDSNPDNKMKFAITKDFSTTARFDLTCPTTFETPNTTETSGTPSGVRQTASTTGPSGTAPASGASASPSGSGKPSSASSLNMFSAVSYAVIALAGGLVFLL